MSLKKYYSIILLAVVSTMGRRLPLAVYICQYIFHLSVVVVSTMYKSLLLGINYSCQYNILYYSIWM